MIYNLSQEEFTYIVNTLDIQSITGFDDSELEFKPDSSVKAIDTLLTKKLLIELKEKDDSSSVKYAMENNLRAFLTIAHETKNSARIINNEDKIMFFFYRDSIVTISRIHSEYEVSWFPTIQLGIGLLLQFIDDPSRNDNFHFFVNSEEATLSKEYHYSAIELKDNEIANVLGQSLVKLHGLEIKKII